MSNPGEGALEYNLTGRCPFTGKRIAFRYPVSELLDYKNLKNNRETMYVVL